MECGIEVIVQGAVESADHAGYKQHGAGNHSAQGGCVDRTYIGRKKRIRNRLIVCQGGGQNVVNRGADRGGDSCNEIRRVNFKIDKRGVNAT